MTFLLSSNTDKPLSQATGIKPTQLLPDKHDFINKSLFLWATAEPDQKLHKQKHRFGKKACSVSEMTFITFVIINIVQCTRVEKPIEI